MNIELKRNVRLAMIVLGAAFAVVTAAVCIKPSSSPAATNGLVPLELVLLVDTSSSVDSDEYITQRSGYAAAFRDADVTAQIETMGGIAVVYIEWDAAVNQLIRIPWTHLRTRGECLDYASTVDGIDRQSSGTTMLAPALEFALNELTTNSFMGMRRVIDVSGDGLCKNWRFYELGIEDGSHSDPVHYGTRWNEVITSVRSAVHSVNGVFIGPAGEHLDFYEDVLPQGSDAFTMHTTSFTGFADTLEQKIMRELTATIPGTYD